MRPAPNRELNRFDLKLKVIGLSSRTVSAMQMLSGPQAMFDTALQLTAIGVSAAIAFAGTNIAR
jgi:hypothetical protein